MYDEIDQFHRRRDLPHLDDGADAGDSSDNEEVLGVRADAEGSDEQLSEDEPGGFDESSDEDEEEGDENAENYLPSAQAWGKKRKDFYDTSYVDKDYGGFSGSDAEDAELEEEEALTLQKRLAEAISEQDYGLDDIVRVAPTTAEKTAPVAERVDIDIAKLTDDGKLQLFKQQSPELEGLIEEYKEKRDALVHLEPFADVIKSLQPHDDHPFLEQVRAAMEIYANYLLNIQFYLYAKAANGVTSTNQLKNHPVLDRIMDWKKVALIGSNQWTVNTIVP
uniref:Uncharacterized protein n=1 Tax=Plectus sambesii TaxID=2011161 RepID=A0A914UQN8_9BILA